KQQDDRYVLNAGILRAYDIRGIVGETLYEADAFHIGRAFGTFVRRKTGTARPRIGLGFDGRLSSPALKEALKTGLLSSGVEVVQIGRGPSPMLYFSVFHLKLDAGVMVTGSHNPPTHNGFKFMVGRKSFFGEEIQTLGRMIQARDYDDAEGLASEEDVSEAYITRLLSALEVDKAKKTLKVAWDAGNGAAGEMMARLCQQLPGEHIILNAKIDGTFPVHHPDPTVPKNLAQLIETVREQVCDFGVAFDGDGDRIGAVDGQGRIIWGDQLLCFFAEDVLRSHPGTPVIADVKASQVLFDHVVQAGGEPLMWKTGHSLIKSKMGETGAKLAGEMSGHIFFADRNDGYDDGLYAAVRLLNIAAQSADSITARMDALPSTCNTPEVRVECPDERKFDVPEEVKARLDAEGIGYNDVDGLRVNLPEGWWLLRASNTQPALVVRCEAASEDGLEHLKAHVTVQLKQSGVEEVF
ncbi:MAG: phosphomannomutase/phosphoglucomutase, partial [Rickettsiales bacterium]|nr:phosphomannomutase/phosphoglucomutase [Rickettsiales bacterium]